MEIMIPVWPEEASASVAKIALDTLKSRSVAIVDDGYDPNYMDEIVTRLKSEYGANIRLFPKPHGSSGSPESLIDEAAQCDVAVVGIAL